MLTLVTMTAYESGMKAAPLLPAAFLVAFVLRARRNASPAAPAPVRSGGLATEAAEPARARRAFRRGDIVAIAVAAVWLVATIGYVATSDGGSSDAWSGSEGASMRAGFVNGCQQSANGLVDCGCVFEALSANPEYDTPAGFASLAPVVQRATVRNDPKLLPAAYLAAVRGCRN